MSSHTSGPLEARAVISQNPLELCAATIHGADGAELGCTWRRVDDPPNAESLPGIDNALLWAAAPELAVALEATVAHVAVPQHKRDDAWHIAGHDLLRQARAALAKAGRLP